MAKERAMREPPQQPKVAVVSKMYRVYLIGEICICVHSIACAAMLCCYAESNDGRPLVKVSSALERLRCTKPMTALSVAHHDGCHAADCS